jgi:hypothetical protein
VWLAEVEASYELRAERYASASAPVEMIEPAP